MVILELISSGCGRVFDEKGIRKGKVDGEVFRRRDERWKLVCGSGCSYVGMTSEGVDPDPDPDPDAEHEAAAATPQSVVQS